jgi:hypothetical protein
MRVKPKIKGLLYLFFGVALVLIGFWMYMGIQLGIWKYSEYDRYHWLTANLPITHELWRGEIQAGDDVEQIVSKWQPHVVRRYGPWMEMRWYPGGGPTNSLPLIGITVVARNGVLVRADSYSDDLLCARTFFTTLTPKAEAERRAAFATHVESLRDHQ